jgi:hypothetical protein
MLEHPATLVKKRLFAEYEKQYKLYVPFFNREHKDKVA